MAYNLPFRDCSQYSAGGAANKSAYEAWIDALAAGIGNRKVVVILEPDGLGIIPFHAALDGKSEWCRPAEANPNAAMYLDGTHSAWLGVGDIASRLVKAGVRRADGFFLNVSNYEPTPMNRDYGHWISQCIHYANNPAEGGKRLGHYEHCASQDHPAITSDYSTWGLGRRRAAPQTWCNPPDRGLGQPPTTHTGNPLVDAYLWIKIPGESDGQCDRGTGTGTDPARGYADPAAGGWFIEQAAELIALANPAIARPSCHMQYGVSDLWPGGFNAKVGIHHPGATPIDGWTLGWTFGEGDGAGPAPLAFTLNGAPCTLQ